MSTCGLPVPVTLASGATSLAWWWASRAWTLLGATILAAILGAWAPHEPHLVSNWGVMVIGVLAWMVALTATTVAAIQDLRGSQRRDDVCGTVLIALESSQALAFTTVGIIRVVFPSMARDLLGLSVCGFTETAIAVLVESFFVGVALAVLVALSCARHRLNLVELLVVVAIIAALVGVAVPMSQPGIAPCHRAKALQDLDTLRTAITLYDSQNRPLTGTSLSPLTPRYLQELPKDPWGNEYMLDASLGLITSFAADQRVGGTDEDADLVVRYKSALEIRRVTCSRGGGRPPGLDRVRVHR